jgi:ABC-type sugar transport system ATPase subunit
MLLQVQGVTKSFGDNAVLRGVDLSVEAGEVVALVGENGAGKSTLTRVISGVHRPDAGAVTFSGERQEFAGPQAAMACGIQVIYQEFRHNLFPHLSVTENLFVRGEGRDHGRVLVSRARMRKDAAELLASIGLDVDPQRTVGSLGVAEQQMVEIAKAIGHDLRLLVLDEPTAALDAETEHALFEQFASAARGQAADGRVTVLVSHRFSTVRMADVIVVLDGARVAEVGSHAELMALGGRYAELYGIQSDAFR